MKVALFCAESLNLFTIIGLLPDDAVHIISSSGINFNAELVANRLNLPFSLTETVDEAVEQADFVFAIRDGTSEKIISAVRTAKKLCFHICSKKGDHTGSPLLFNFTCL